MKEKLSLARILCFVGILVISAGLLCNALEVVSLVAFRIFTLVGTLTILAALIVSLKQKRF